MRRTRVFRLVPALVATLAGCQGGGAGSAELLAEREGAITGCSAKSVTTVATVVYDYDLAGRQTRDRDAKLLYDPWNQLKEIQLNTTTSPKYNDGRTVVAEKHTYGFDGTRTSTTTNPGAANAAVRVQITPDDVIHDGKREHYVRLGSRIVARLAMTASGTLALNNSPGARAGAERLPAGLPLPAPSSPPAWLVLGFAAVVLAAAVLRTWRRGRRWAPSFWGVALLGASCQMFGQGVIGNSSSLLLAEKVYFHTSLGAGPSLITRQDGTILEERRFEPFGVPINAFRSGRPGVAAVDLVTDPQSVVGKQADASNGFTDHGARWLSSQSGRWLTPDAATRLSVKQYVTAPWSINPYQYVQQNPMRSWDPDGRKLVLTDAPGASGATQQIRDTVTADFSVTKLGQDKDGSIHIQRTAEGPLTKLEQRFADTVGPVLEDKKSTINMTVDRSAPWNFDDFLTHTLDANDFKNVLTPKSTPTGDRAPTAAGKFGHAVMEQGWGARVLGDPKEHKWTQNDMDEFYSPAHVEGLNAEASIDGATRIGTERTYPGGGISIHTQTFDDWGSTYTWSYKQDMDNNLSPVDE
jgi:RHS repeat-associated protein